MALLSDPGALPGDARDAARGDAGERGDRDRVRDRGPRRRRARPGDREPVLRAAPRRRRPRRSTTCSRDAEACGRFVSEREANDLAHAAEFRAERHAVQHEQIERLGERLPLPRDRAAVPVHARHRPARRSTRSPARSRAGSRRCDARRVRDPSLVVEHGVLDLLRQRRRRQDDDRGGARARRRAPGPQHVRDHDRSRPSGSPTRSGSKRSPTRRARSTAARWDDDDSAKPDGALSAMMLDTKSTFDHLVTGNATTPEQAQRILDNRFYRNVSGALGGTQEYMAMEKLHELHDGGNFDLIVIDTPPTRHALDFLDAPRRLLRLLDNRIFRMLMMPTRAYLRVASVAVQTFLRTVAARRRLGGDRRRRRVLPRVRRDGGRLPRSRARGRGVARRARDRLRARDVAASRRDGRGAVLRAAARAQRPEDRRADREPRAPDASATKPPPACAPPRPSWPAPATTRPLGGSPCATRTSPTSARSPSSSAPTWRACRRGSARRRSPTCPTSRATSTTSRRCARSAASCSTLRLVRPPVATA